MGRRSFGTAITYILSGLLCATRAFADTNSAYLSPGFHFDYDKANQPLAIPVTGQCERIHLEWNRGGNDTGPLPVAPYSLQVFTSTFQTPFQVAAGFGPSFDWDVPFTPGTQYQICMFDTNGVSGGCQRTYTVIANTTVNNPTCQNITVPSAMTVAGTTPLGLLGRYSYIDQCASLTVTPKTGLPPFTFTVAPEFHPPFNITSKNGNPIEWQVQLPRGFRFFLSLSSSDGLLWANGPMMVGGNGPTTCLSPGSVAKSDLIKIILGTVLGGTVLGLLMGSTGVIIYTRAKQKKRAPSQAYRDQIPSDHPSHLLKTMTPSPSTIGSATAFNYPSSPSQNSTSMPLAIPLTPVRASHSVSEYGSSEITVSTPPPPPPIQQPPQRYTSRRSRAVLEPHSVEPSEASSSSSYPTTPVQTKYPPDIKRRPMDDFTNPLLEHEGSTASTERRSEHRQPTQMFALNSDTASLASTSGTTSASSNLNRSTSVVSRAPTYVPYAPNVVPSRRRRNIFSIDETETTDLPPQYADHTDDLSVAPSIISSNRF